RYIHALLEALHAIQENSARTQLSHRLQQPLGDRVEAGLAEGLPEKFQQAALLRGLQPQMDPLALEQQRARALIEAEVQAQLALTKLGWSYCSADLPQSAPASSSVPPKADHTAHSRRKQLDLHRSCVQMTWVLEEPLLQ